MKAKELDLLDRLSGDWSVELMAKMPDGSSLKGRGVVHASSLSLDRGIRSEIRLDVPGMGEYHEDDLWGFDQWEKKVHLYSITSTGAVHDHYGTWKDDSTLVLHWDGLYEGKTSTEDDIIRFISDKEIRVHEDDTSEGKPGPVFDYVLKKE